MMQKKNIVYIFTAGFVLAVFRIFDLFRPNGIIPE
jgi:hypothetical protein